MTLVITHAKVTSGTVNADVEVDLSDWNANHTLTGVAGLSQGGTAADLSATGGTSQVLKQSSTGAPVTVGQLAASDIGSGAALTRVNDTNVTATLGGTPTTALLAATSITLGWTGTLAASRGGFGADVSAQSGVPLFAAGVPTFTSTTGSGNFVRATSPTLVTPALGTPTSGVLTSCTAFTLTTTGSSGAATYSAGTLNIPQYSGGGVTSLNGQTGAQVSYFPPQGRITLASGVPVMATSQSGATTVYYTPYQGNMVPIYDGTNMVPTSVAEVSQATTDTTKSPAAVAASKFYDLFVWNDSGTIRCTRGPAWTNATTRGYTLTMVNGILLNTSSITNGPAASRGTWVGCIGSNGSSTIDWTLGSAGSGGVAAVLNVYNAYNRVLVGTTVTDTSATHTYTSATIRQWGGGSGMQVTFLSGATEDAFVCQVNGQSSTVAVINASASFGIGYDATNAFSAQNFLIFNFAAAAQLTGGGVNMQKSDFGQHFFSFNEKSDGSNANNFNNASLANITFTGRM